MKWLLIKLVLNFDVKLTRAQDIVNTMAKFFNVDLKREVTKRFFIYQIFSNEPNKKWLSKQFSNGRVEGLMEACYTLYIYK